MTPAGISKGITRHNWHGGNFGKRIKIQFISRALQKHLTTVHCFATRVMAKFKNSHTHQSPDDCGAHQKVDGVLDKHSAKKLEWGRRREGSNLLVFGRESVWGSEGKNSVTKTSTTNYSKIDRGRAQDWNMKVGNEVEFGCVFVYLQKWKRKTFVSSSFFTSKPSLGPFSSTQMYKRQNAGDRRTKPGLHNMRQKTNTATLWKCTQVKYLQQKILAKNAGSQHRCPL